MNYGIIRYIIGWILLCVAGLMLLPLAVSIGFGETCWSAFLLSILVGAIIGGVLVCKKPAKTTMYLKEGFVITAMAWIVMSILGAAPFVLSGAIPDPVDALFETVSGFTTTGASILPQVENLPSGILFWRSFTHWIGGMGVLVFLLVLLPMTGGSHMNLMKAESPGPQVEKLVPKVQTTAAILYGIYLGLTLLQLLILWVSGMNWFDAATTAFGTAGTGGFGIKNDSMAGYTPFQQNVVTVFMILFGINFNFYFFLLLKKVRRALSMEEVRWYLGIIAAATLFITFDVADRFDNLLTALRHAAFQVGSIITTTGFATTDFDLWPSASKTILVLLMFVGACAGSTGGGLKVSRLVILLKSSHREIRGLLHPQGVSVVAMDKKTIPASVVRSTMVYLAVYILMFAVSVFAISLDGFDPVTNFTAVAATFNNIGPGLALVGPTQNFGLFSHLSKLVLTFDMLAGRLELFPILLLFSRETWKKF